jgi:ABC-type transport system involved in multi-copper enzyme maturation permease subunit
MKARTGLILLLIFLVALIIFLVVKSFLAVTFINTTKQTKTYWVLQHKEFDNLNAYAELYDYTYVNMVWTNQSHWEVTVDNPLMEQDNYPINYTYYASDFITQYNGSTNRPLYATLQFYGKTNSGSVLITTIQSNLTCGASFFSACHSYNTTDYPNFIVTSTENNTYYGNIQYIEAYAILNWYELVT